MKAKKMIFLVLIMVIVLPKHFVCAEQIYYINGYGVEFKKDEYDFISKFYFDGYQDYITAIEYDEMITSNIMQGRIKIVSSDDKKLVGRASNFYETSSKSIKISSSCSSVCYISIVAEWKKNPTIRSYDVIGTLLENVDLKSNPITTLYYSSGSVSSSSIKQLENGYGATIKLPSSGSNFKIIQSVTTSNIGVVRASYQHAKMASTLNKSQKFTISSDGYGGVFEFDKSVKDYYDAMNGVKLSL